MNDIRPPSCQGRFYAGSEDELLADVERYLSRESGVSARAVVAPHAGYVFSGPVAGHAFGALSRRSESIERVVLLGPSHFVGFEGLAASPHRAFRTPLGTVDVDEDAIDSLVDDGLVRRLAEPHDREHSLETHLPFLQYVLGDFHIVPIVTGRAEGRSVADVLERFWADEATVFSISSDLSHFHSYEQARDIDEQTADHIEAFNPDEIGPDHACGYVALRGMLAFADVHGMSIERLAMCNSGDTAGDRDRVVGYGAWALR